MADSINIQSLIERCHKGKRKAQYELYRYCYSFLLPVCMRYERNEEDARAVLNEGFLKILDNLSKYNPEIPFEAWCKRITINTIIDAYRKDRKKPQTIDCDNLIQEGEEKGASLNEALDIFSSDDLEKMLKSLPAKSRKVFNLYAIDGYSHKEICAQMGISEGTSKWHLNFARQKLGEMLESMKNPSPKESYYYETE